MLNTTFTPLRLLRATCPGCKICDRPYVAPEIQPVKESCLPNLFPPSLPATGPVRIRSEPVDRCVAEELDHAAERISYHMERCKEEKEVAQHRAMIKTRRVAAKLLAKNQRIMKKFGRMADKGVASDVLCNRIETNVLVFLECKEAIKEIQKKLERYIDAIETRRAGLAWECPNDGQAHPFTWKGIKYHRTYTGEMWRSEDWSWAGRWMGYYIGTKFLHPQ